MTGYAASSGQSKFVRTHDGRFVLTWEECRKAEQYNENSYTRDERHLFDAEEILAFVEQSGYSVSAFNP